MKKILKPKGLFQTKPHSTPPAVLQKLQNEIFLNQNLKESGEFIGILNSEVRQQIVFLLSKKESLCVGDIAEVLRIGISAVSHQLKILREAKVVQSRRRKKVVYYSLSEKLPALALAFLREAFSV